MEIKLLDQLREVDSRTQAFTPLGLGTDRQLTPEAAVQFQQERMARLELTPGVRPSLARNRPYQMPDSHTQASISPSAHSARRTRWATSRRRIASAGRGPCASY